MRKKFAKDFTDGADIFPEWNSFIRAIREIRGFSSV